MTIEKIRELPVIAVAAMLLAVGGALFAGSTAHAQTLYTAGNGTVYQVPVGFLASSYGAFYDSQTGEYYDPITGQYSTTEPVGPAALDPTGAYVVPAGYVAGGGFGTYYSATSGMYYDPAIGFYSSTAPVGPIYPPSATASTTNPGLPNTGAGGNAPETIALLGLTALVAFGGAVLLSRMIRKTPAAM
jgi:hypothetical protein